MFFDNEQCFHWAPWLSQREAQEDVDRLTKEHGDEEGTEVLWAIIAEQPGDDAPKMLCHGDAKLRLDGVTGTRWSIPLDYT